MNVTPVQHNHATICLRCCVTLKTDKNQNSNAMFCPRQVFEELHPSSGAESPLYSGQTTKVTRRAGTLDHVPRSDQRLPRPIANLRIPA